MEDGANLITETCERVFRDCADPRAVVLDPDGARSGWRDALWDALAETGLTSAWAPEERGGAGASVREGFGILHAAGRFAAAVPLADTLVAGRLLARAGLAVPAGRRLALAQAGREEPPIALGADGRLIGAAPKVPFAREADQVVVVVADEGAAEADEGGGGAVRVVLVERTRCRLVEGASIAGDPLDRLEFDGFSPEAVGERLVARGEAHLFGAASRAMLIAGALQAILDLSVEYSLERIAFGRPIARFQAVQQNLARLAGETAAANAAATSAAWALENQPVEGDAVFIEVAAAKVRTGEAAQTGALIAHQVHGALGYTREHVLHRYTHRLWSWRDEFGAESEWALALGAHFAKAGADGMWPALTAI